MTFKEKYLNKLPILHNSDPRHNNIINKKALLHNSLIILFLLFNIASLPNTGQHWCRERRRAHAPPCPCTLVPGLPAAGSRLWWLPVWHAPDEPQPSTSPSVFLWDSWWRASAPGVGDGQDRLWPEILPQVSMLAASVDTHSCITQSSEPWKVCASFRKWE